MTEIYHVTQEVPCRFCKGVGSKCYVCKGTGVEGAAVDAPVSVLVWKDAEAMPEHADFVLLAFVTDGGEIGVSIAAYIGCPGGWYTAYGQCIWRPIAYAELTIPPELAEVTP